MQTFGSAAAVLAALLFAGGCDRAMLGLPRIAVSAPSPDGSRVAYVRNHPTIDGPSQSLWIARRDETGSMILRLAEDSDWCDTVVWSSDSSTAGFLIRGARLITVQAASGRVLSDQWLTPHAGSYPPDPIATSLRLARDGQGVHFIECRRVRTASGYRASDCIERTLALPVPRA